MSRRSGIGETGAEPFVFVGLVFVVVLVVLGVVGGLAGGLIYLIRN